MERKGPSRWRASSANLGKSNRTEQSSLEFIVGGVSREGNNVRGRRECHWGQERLNAVVFRRHLQPSKQIRGQLFFVAKRHCNFFQLTKIHCPVQSASLLSEILFLGLLRRKNVGRSLFPAARPQVFGTIKSGSILHTCRHC